MLDGHHIYCMSFFVYFWPVICSIATIVFISGLVLCFISLKSVS